ncbi:SIMPL domain-containing protein [Aridibaculum aurantiacum]|uniref:SIMPL domain-containing protein n=1 Tax=Aridibaculum aurantiacum TaxID=2810307 RepID=UPI001A9612C7|nr:SIMPL domain-containing protein [Aridibaculum aurantiacum]
MKKIFLLLLVCSQLITLRANSQDANRQKTVNVSGTAEMEIVPDEIYVHVELREYDKKGGSKVDIDKIKNDFLKAALAVGIPETDLSVQGYQGWDGNQWWYKKNKKKNPDMKASITYQVKLASTRKMDELVQKLDDEATHNFFIARVSHSKIQDLKKQLKIQAVKAAKEKAIYLSEAIGEKVGDAISINEPNEVQFHPQPVYANRMMAQEATMAADFRAPSSPEIDFKKMKLKFDVHVTFSLK